MKNSCLPLFIVFLLLVSCGGNQQAKTDSPEDGKINYDKYCLACHQTDGSGVPGMYPPLTRTDWVAGDKSRLIEVVLNGLKGEIKVNDQVYKTEMPNHLYLSDAQIAAILTYIRSNFGNEADAVLPADVATIRNNNP